MSKNGNHTDNPRLKAALVYATNSEFPLHIFPSPPGEKKSYFAQRYDPDGQPWGMTTRPDKIKKYWKDYPEANVAIVTGPINSLWALDADTMEGHGKDGIGNLEKLIAAHGGEWPVTRMQRSPSGSIHYLWNWPEGDVTILNS